VKKVLQKARIEKAVYYSDLTGEELGEFVPVTISVCMDYGSKYDGTEFNLHLTDNDYKKIVSTITNSISSTFLCSLLNLV
jgi:hypothetical protein